MSWTQLLAAQLSVATSYAYLPCLWENGVLIDLPDMKRPSKLEILFISTFHMGCKGEGRQQPGKSLNHVLHLQVSSRSKENNGNQDLRSFRNLPAHRTQQVGREYFTPCNRHNMAMLAILLNSNALCVTKKK